MKAKFETALTKSSESSEAVASVPRASGRMSRYSVLSLDGHGSSAAADYDGFIITPDSLTACVWSLVGVGANEHACM